MRRRSPVRLRHAECVAIDAAGDVWCGGESAEIYRIDGDGSALELVASSDGASLGIAFDESGCLHVCDAFVGAVDRLDPRSGELQRFARVEPGAMRIPNFPVVDTRRGYLYVSDSHSFDEAGPGIWTFDRQQGKANCGIPSRSGSRTAWRCRRTETPSMWPKRSRAA
jgi:sugar lactone lactonase YvrE